MTLKHLFKAKLNWIPEKAENSTSKIYNKSLQIQIEGKTVLDISSVKAFKDDPELYNPEE